MKIIDYELIPEAPGSKGMFVTKKGTIAELIIDTGMLIHADYDKVIPHYKELNKLFMKGLYPRAGEWNPFEITVDEYKEIVEFLINLPLARPYRINDYT